VIVSSPAPARRGALEAHTVEAASVRLVRGVGTRRRDPGHGGPGLVAARARRRRAVRPVVDERAAVHGVRLCGAAPAVRARVSEAGRVTTPDDDCGPRYTSTYDCM
jgi:hypothetical protein